MLTHDGLDSDRQLARKVRGIDIIVGGHSHTAVRDPVIESGTVIVQAGSNGIYLGVLNVTFDPKQEKDTQLTHAKTNSGWFHPQRALRSIRRWPGSSISMKHR